MKLKLYLSNNENFRKKDCHLHQLPVPFKYYQTHQYTTGMKHQASTKEKDFTQCVTEFSIYKPYIKLGFYFNHFT